jgi:uncharacterized protein
MTAAQLWPDTGDDDARVADFRRRIGRAHLIDAHTHFMPDRLLAAVRAYFDAAGPLVGHPWPIRYRQQERHRIEVLRGFGVRALEALEQVGLGAAWLRAVCHDNAAALFGI